ncbi:hypothetical protein [Lacihabitans sp. CCS-44]|uniref:hypothetical protein n=1 Tax=Lacihabitans sp. CCS-44 TaxID=2487331 RepID=UPI0020CF25C2|nr:hypothetical protein [Lacihabitans sp. CCS-44]
MPTEKYRLLPKSTEDLVELKSQWKKSKIEIEMDFKTGEFKGFYKKTAFSGKYDIQKVTSGFVKGFNYKVELAFLTKDGSENAKLDEFVEKLAKCERIFVTPDKLIDSQFVTAEFKSAEESDKLMFVLLK